MKTVTIQIQDLSGNWLPVQTIRGDDQTVKITLDTTSKMMRKRLRAVDSNGTVLDVRN